MLVTAPGRAAAGRVARSTSWPSACRAASACCTPPPSGVAEVTHGPRRSCVVRPRLVRGAAARAAAARCRPARSCRPTPRCASGSTRSPSRRPRLGGDEIVWDLYSGIGSIALALAGSAGQVYGVEVVEEAVERAVENAERNGVDERRVRRRATSRRPCARCSRPGCRARTWSCSTRRAPGLTPKAVRRVLELEPQRIVYVSCNPTTLAGNARAARRGRLPAGARAAGRHVPAHAPRRVRRAVRGRRQRLIRRRSRASQVADARPRRVGRPGRGRRDQEVAGGDAADGRRDVSDQLAPGVGRRPHGRRPRAA